MEKNLLVWRRSGLPAVLYLGIVSACLLWSLSVGMGLDEGFAAGTQALETGQVLVEAQGVSLDQYFTLKAMVQNLQGVSAVSERMYFQAEIIDTLGIIRQVSVRGIDFADEGKVTGLGSRLENLKTGDPSNLFAPLAWKSTNLLDVTQAVTFSLQGSNGTSQKIEVSGFYLPTKRKEESATLLMAMDQARILYGDDIRVNEMAIRLNQGVDPKVWVRAHRDDFKSLQVSLIPWNDSAFVRESRMNFRSESVRFYSILTLILGLSGFSMVFYGWKSRSPRSSLALALLGGPKNWWIRAVVYLLMISFTLTIVYLVQPVYQSWLMSGLLEDYPFVGKASMYWSWDWEVFAVPALFLGLTILVAQWKPRFIRRQE